MNNNGKKRFGRRAGFGIAAIVLITAAYYISLFKGVSFEWFADYSFKVLGLYFFIMGALTATDIWGKR